MITLTPQQLLDQVTLDFLRGDVERARRRVFLNYRQMLKERCRG